MSWQPDHLSPKQKKILDNRKKFLLLNGPRKATKTLGGVASVAWHLWRTKGARYSVLSTTQTVAHDGGTWVDLVNEMERWIAGDFGMKWIKKPKPENTTHKVMFEVSNAHGGVSYCQLDSLDDERQAAAKFKQRRNSGVYMCELANFKLRSTFDMMMETLRMPHLKEEEHQLIADTNPAPDGPDSWIYDLWYVFPYLDDAGLEAYIRKSLPDLSPEEMAEQIQANKDLQQQFGKMEFTLDDNIWMTKQQLAMQKARYAHNKDAYARNVQGLWVKGTEEGIFQDVFRPNFHIIGDPETPSNPDPTILLPTEQCWKLAGGWDYGDKNKAVVLGEAWDQVKPGVEKTVKVFSVLAEVIQIGEKTPLWDFVARVEEKMNFLEFQCDNKIQWNHYSDRSSFESYNSVSDSYEWMEVSSASNGRISLTPSAKKSAGSVAMRVDLVMKLLFHERLFISAQCPILIEMFSMLKAGKTSTLDTGSKYKHAFDCLTYWLVMELWDELLMDEFARTGKAQKAKGTGVVSMSL